MPRLLLLVALCLAGLGCSTGWRLDERRAEVLTDVRRGDYDHAARTLDRLYDSEFEAEAAAISDKHGLLWLLERGLLALHADDLEQARWHLAHASERAEALMAADLVAGAVSAVANDTVRDYVGTAYERECATYFLALAELIDAARARGAIPGEAVAAQRITALDRFDRAINALRNLCLVQVPWTEDAAGDDRYRGAAWFHLAAAAAVLAHPQPLDSDLDFAGEMLRRAEERYLAEHHRYHGARAFRYEVAPSPRLVEQLRWRLLARRSPHARERRLAELGTDLETLRREGVLPPSGSGAVLVLDHRGFTARPLPLDVRLIPTDFGSLGHRKPHDFRVGWMGFSVRGPGRWMVEDWGVLPMPGKLMGELAPGGLAVMGFSIPSHAPDHPIVPPPVVSARALEATWDGSRPGEIVADLDAWARAELKDDQPQVLLKTLVRAALKQLAAGQVATEARRQGREQHGAGGGALIGLLVNLVGSSLATASEQADIRAVTLLPDHIAAGLIDLPPGRYHLRLRRGASERSIGEVTVPSNGLVVLPLFDPTPVVPPGLAAIRP